MIRNRSQHETSQRRVASRLGTLRSGAAPSTSELGTQNSELRTRPAFTLIELLVSIAVVAILAGIVMVGVGAATESDKKRKTETLVTVLNELLMERYDSYQTRRVPVTIPPGTSPPVAADLRLNGIRELMKIEMPDRWSDVIMVPGTSPLGTVNNFPPSAPPTSFPQQGVTGIPRTAISQAYLRRYRQLTSADPVAIQSNQGAECLYMIITMATGDGDALSHFRDADIGDVDNDGAKEFLDGWGKPISFIRWPAGFVSELQPLTPGGTDPVADRDAANDHDPFDVMRRDDPSVTGAPLPSPNFRSAPAAYRLVPLIYSAGPDQLFDINTSSNVPSGLDPYSVLGTGSDLVGTEGDINMDGDNNWTDNIHNHLLNRR